MRPEDLHRLLLRLYPRAFRERFGRDLLETLRDGARRARARGGRRGLAAFWLRSAGQALVQGSLERLAGLWTRTRGGGGGGMTRGAAKDAVVAVRGLRARPGLGAVAILTMALGVGSVTAIFTVVNGVLLRPLPFPDADRLTVIWDSSPARGRPAYRITGGNFLDWRRESSSFTDMTAFSGAGWTLTGPEGDPRRLGGGRITAGYFRVLGVEPVLGRAFLPEENRGPHRVVILSHALWRGRFGGDPDVVDRTITLDGVDYRVVGVAPPGPLPLGGGQLRLADPGESLAWIPLDFESPWVGGRFSHVLAAVARLAPQVELEEAQAEMSALARSLAEAHPASNKDLGVLLRSLEDQVVGEVRADLVLLLAGVLLLLLVACANLANLLGARALDRQRELALRSALGAGRWRLVRQILTETLTLGVLGGGLGTALAVWGSGALLSLLPRGLPRQDSVQVDGTVLLASLAVILAASLAAGLLPALRAARADVGRVLRRDGDGRGTAGPARSRGGRILVAGQLALATPLLVAAGLLVRSFQELRAVDPGFQKDGIVLVDLALPRPAYDTPERVRAFHDGLRGRVAALPGVESATFTYDHPLETNWFTGFALEHLPPPEPGEAPSALLRIVDAGYVEALGIPLLAGRSFAPADRIDAPGVALVNETFARRFLPGEEPLGKRIREGTSAGNWPDSDPPTSFEIVGVVGNVRFAGLRAEAEPALYLPAAQFPYWNMTLVVQASAGVSELAGPIREAVWSLDGRLPVAGMESLEAAFARAVAQDRFNALLLALFAGVALILAAGGVFGVLSQSVAGRRREVGVRLALGAAPRRVRGRVVREGMGMALQGLAVGLGASLVAGRLLGSLLFGVEPLDPAVLLVTVSSLGVAALVSTWIPARRAAGVDPAESLRTE